MYSRIETLLEMTNLMNREEKDIDLNKNLLEIDFSRLDSILNIERKKSFDFLSNAMKVNYEWFMSYKSICIANRW